MCCPSCGGTVIFTEGCKLCINCGWSPCYSNHRRHAPIGDVLFKVKRFLLSS